MSVDEYDKDIEWIVRYNGTTTHKFEPICRLVRCKDCKYAHRLPEALTCRRLAQWYQVKDDDYCSYGEREEQT